MDCWLNCFNIRVRWYGKGFLSIKDKQWEWMGFEDKGFWVRVLRMWVWGFKYEGDTLRSQYKGIDLI